MFILLIEYGGALFTAGKMLHNINLYNKVCSTVIVVCACVHVFTSVEHCTGWLISCSSPHPQ